jgi:hypothetical protein
VALPRLVVPKIDCSLRIVKLVYLLRPIRGLVKDICKDQLVTAGAQVPEFAICRFVPPVSGFKLSEKNDFADA